MISDKYQGEIVCLVLKDLISKGELFGGKSSHKFDKFKAFSTGRLSTMEGWYVMSNRFSIFNE
jgi:hexokinase